jgi:hypothetical protein
LQFFALIRRGKGEGISVIKMLFAIAADFFAIFIDIIEK